MDLQFILVRTACQLLDEMLPNMPLILASVCGIALTFLVFLSNTPRRS